jgi:hypothetical protein
MITIIFILLVSGLLGFNIIGRLIIPPINDFYIDTKSGNRIKWKEYSE